MKDGHEDDGKKNPEFFNIMYNEYALNYVNIPVNEELTYFRS
jgi:hypothetical protein